MLRATVPTAAKRRMQIYTTLVQNRLASVPAEIRRIEAAGYNGVLTQESRHDPFLPLGVAAINSERRPLARRCCDWQAR